MRVQRNNCRNITPPIIATLVAGLILALPSVPAAHEVPTSVTIQMFVKPDGDRLHLLVRVPMTAMRDLDFPTLGPGYLDIENAEFSLRNAALLWIANDVRLYENDTDLGNPQLVAARVSLPSDRSFEGYDEALANIMGPPLPNDTSVPSPFFGSCRPVTWSAPSSIWEIRGWSGSTRAGTKRPCSSSSWDFFISWMGPTICCSLFVW